MATHLFRIGSIVSFNGSDGQSATRSAFKIEAQLPPVGNFLQYKIKSEAEGFSRVVVEHHLTAAGSAGRHAPKAPPTHGCEED